MELSEIPDNFQTGEKIMIWSIQYEDTETGKAKIVEFESSSCQHTAMQAFHKSYDNARIIHMVAL
jgi:hypothetical protein